METPHFIGEIKIFAGNFAPAGWAFCDGQKLTVKDNLSLFNLIRTNFGGDGKDTFTLPDLRGRVAVGIGNGGLSFRKIGEIGGVEQVTLITQHLPKHTHNARCSNDGETSDSPKDNYWAKSNALQYNNVGATADKRMASGAVMPEGSGKAHNNMLPFLSLNYIIALTGDMPDFPFIPGQ